MDLTASTAARTCFDKTESCSEISPVSIGARIVFYSPLRIGDNGRWEGEPSGIAACVSIVSSGVLGLLGSLPLRDAGSPAQDNFCLSPH